MRRPGGLIRTPGIASPSPSLRGARPAAGPSAGLRAGPSSLCRPHVLWIVGGRLPLRGVQGTGACFAPSVVLSPGLSLGAGVALAVHSEGTGSVSNAILDNP